MLSLGLVVDRGLFPLFDHFDQVFSSLVGLTRGWYTFHCFSVWLSLLTLLFSRMTARAVCSSQTEATCCAALLSPLSSSLDEGLPALGACGHQLHMKPPACAVCAQGPWPEHWERGAYNVRLCFLLYSCTSAQCTLIMGLCISTVGVCVSLYGIVCILPPCMGCDL